MTPCTLQAQTSRRLVKTMTGRRGASSAKASGGEKAEPTCVYFVFCVKHEAVKAEVVEDGVKIVED